jgi:exopolysaccharide biosynthesis polyprenyl glycosylphosphotransferase
MLKRFSLTHGVLSLFVDMTAVITAFICATYLRQTLPYGRGAWHEGLGLSPVFYIITACLWATVASVISLYDPRKQHKVVDELQSLTLAIGFFSLGIAGVMYFTFRETPRLLVFYALLTSWVLLLLWRLAMRAVFRARNRWQSDAGERVLIVGAGNVGQQVGHIIRSYAWTGLTLAGYLDDDPPKRGSELPVLGGLQDIRKVVRAERIDDVVLALPPGAYEETNWLVSTMHSLPVRVRVIPDYFNLALYRATVEDFGGIPMINLRDPMLNDYQRLVKRLFDIAVSGTLAVLTLPLMALVALSVRLDSPGPVLFRQRRVGENGRQFWMYKFRSMVNGASRIQRHVNQLDAEGNLVHKRSGDPRVTRVGRFIRRLSLDELPQLFNVLKGDMSLVGPRPELPWLVQRYQTWQRKRFAVPQGITGWWQVNGRSDKMMYLHTDEDLYYVQNYSLWLDLYILLKTPWVALKGKGAF